MPLHTSLLLLVLQAAPAAEPAKNDEGDKTGLVRRGEKEAADGAEADLPTGDEEDAQVGSQPPARKVVPSRKKESEKVDESGSRAKAGPAAPTAAKADTKPNEVLPKVWYALRHGFMAGMIGVVLVEALVVIILAPVLLLIPTLPVVDDMMARPFRRGVGIGLLGAVLPGLLMLAAGGVAATGISAAKDISIIMP